MTEFVVLSLPSLIYLLVRRRRSALRPTAAAIGLQTAQLRDYAAAIGVVIVGALLGYAAFLAIPSVVLDDPNVVMGQSLGGLALVNTVMRALGEEIFFRGLIASVAIRRFGFARGNAIQALVFLAPHLLLLAVDTALWPILPVQLVSGWLMGWLLHRSGSVAPPALAHATINIAFGLFV